MDWGTITRRSLIGYIIEAGMDNVRFRISSIPETEFLIDKNQSPRMTSGKICLISSRNEMKIFNLDLFTSLVREGKIEVESLVPLETGIAPVSKL